ncbi:hypothetical protein HMN09_01160900 [Mycena chlorophos]|uniref:Virilizer N-terminal domain-containing protein n=1 Tax=Mycena chlorophos TaxID=658473 RepID=A0A8H6S7I8_MYCCL|nr:hypothetical protein HMN09_01160900 [Mycena chlorophos]
MSALLHWATLEPSPDTGIAALRFTAPLRISSLRVFPTGATPFLDVVACTEPEAFFLDIFFNALPTSQEAKDKQRPTNALVPTSIGYAGGEVDFEVDMGEDYATRLMIVKGDFKSISIAIYGEIVAEAPPTQPEYAPRLLPELNPLPLSEPVDPASMRDPTQVARQLLDLIPNSPNLELVIRLMFCLKPSNEDWDLPEFPYLFADLEEQCDTAFDLELALELTTRPLPDDTPHEKLSAFAVKVAETIGPKTADQAYLVSRLLVVSASQHPDMARTLLQHVDMEAVFDAQTLEDDMTMLNLIDAVSNADIARHFNGQWFTVELDKLQANSAVSKLVKGLATRLNNRIHRWITFEDALSNADGNFDASTQFLEDIGTEDQSVGVWLETMIMQSKLAAAPVPAVRTPPPSLLQTHRSRDTTYSQFVAFVRAYIGVASVLAVWAWADSFGVEACRTRTLAIVRLWQTVDGYREIVNHLLLLRQLARRLQWITSGNETPRQSAIIAEQLLCDLASDPRALLSPDVVAAITALEESQLAFIPEHELQLLTKMAFVARDNIPAAIEELVYESAHPLSLRRLRAVRVVLAVLNRELDEGDVGQWSILEALWRENAHGLAERLAQMFIEISEDLRNHFGLDVPPTGDASLVEQLFQTGDDLLRLVVRLIGEQVLTLRGLRNLVSAVADVFACTHLADRDMARSEAGIDLRQSCLDLVSAFIQPDVFVEPRKPAAEVVFRTLLEHPLAVGRSRDPAVTVLQTLVLVDFVLPKEPAADLRWMTSIVPNTLFELAAFFHVLEPEKKVLFVTRLIKLDDGLIGVGEWLLTQELKHLSEILESPHALNVVEHHQLYLSLHFLSKLVNASPDISQWLTTTISSVPEISALLTGCFTALLDLQLMSPVLDDVTRVLAMRNETFEADLKSALLLTTLRAFRHEPLLLLDVLRQDLPWAASHPHYPALLRLEIGQTLTHIASGPITGKVAGTAISILTWMTQHGQTTVSGISQPMLAQLYEKLIIESLPPTSLSTLKSVSAALRVSEDDAMPPAPTELPRRLQMPLQELIAILNGPGPQAPSTPKISHTPDILGVLTSPTGLLRSPAATGLTKTYQRNDFRSLRSAPAARLNTSRLPSMHVDVGVARPESSID